MTKGFGPAEVAAAFEAGLRDFGENYADELVAKWGTLGRKARWHYLGAVQRNKVGRLAPYVDCWQSVARVVEGEAIERHRAELLREPGSQLTAPASLLVEVDTTGAAGRGGCGPGQVAGVVAGLRELGCRVDGLMTVAPAGDPDAARAAFDLVARLAGELGLGELSMGMSGDLEQAVAAGRDDGAPRDCPVRSSPAPLAGCNNRVLGGGLEMASFVQRALMYLGLKDIDEEEDYDGDEEEAAEPAPSRVRQSAYPEPVPQRVPVASVRPLPARRVARCRPRLRAGRSCGPL